MADPQMSDEERAREILRQADNEWAVDKAPYLFDIIAKRIVSVLSAVRQEDARKLSRMKKALDGITAYACHGPDCYGGDGNRCSCGFLQAEAIALAAIRSSSEGTPHEKE